MPDFYSIVEVKAEWMLQPEAMGGKEKFWYRQPGELETSWLFKYPRAGTGEHWAEKIAAEIAESLSIRHARVELAVLKDRPGIVTESFARGGRELAHGNQVLARKIRGYDPDLFRPALTKLEKLDKSSVSDLVSRVPDDCISPSARKFAIALTRYNLEQLKRVSL